MIGAACYGHDSIPVDELGPVQGARPQVNVPAERCLLAEALMDAARIAEDRQKLYGSAYQKTGAALLALFGGTIPEIREEKAAARLYLMVMLLMKLRRQATTIDSGGHEDSADDLVVYGAMLKEFIDEQ